MTASGIIRNLLFIIVVAVQTSEDGNQPPASKDRHLYLRAGGDGDRSMSTKKPISPGHHTGSSCDHHNMLRTQGADATSDGTNTMEHTMEHSIITSGISKGATAAITTANNREPAERKLKKPSPIPTPCVDELDRCHRGMCCPGYECTKKKNGICIAVPTSNPTNEPTKQHTNVSLIYFFAIDLVLGSALCVFSDVRIWFFYDVVLI